MLCIRLSRAGRKRLPFYHVIAIDQRRARDSGKREVVGYFNPMARGQEIPCFLDLQRIQHLRNNGAQMSHRAASLLKQYDHRIAS
jgi:small subunit ribosomal protein S16